MKSKKRQQGLTLIGWVFVLGTLAFFSILVIKSAPIYLNHYKVVSILKTVANQPGAAEATPNELRKTFQKRFDIDMVSRVSEKEVKVSTEGGRRSLTLDYEVRIHMLYNVDAVYIFSEVVPLGGASLGGV